MAARKKLSRIVKKDIITTLIKANRPDLANKVVTLKPTKASGPEAVDHVAIKTGKDGRYYMVPFIKGKPVSHDNIPDPKAQKIMSKRWNYSDDAHDEVQKVFRNATVSVSKKVKAAGDFKEVLEGIKKVVKTGAASKKASHEMHKIISEVEKEFSPLTPGDKTRIQEWVKDAMVATASVLAKGKIKGKSDIKRELTVVGVNTEPKGHFDHEVGGRISTRIGWGIHLLIAGAAEDWLATQGVVGGSTKRKRKVKAAISKEAQRAFDDELFPRVLRRHLDNALNEIEKVMLGIADGRWPSTQIQYAVERHRPLSMMAEDFIDQLTDAYINWSSKIRKA